MAAAACSPAWHRPKSVTPAAAEIVKKSRGSKVPLCELFVSALFFPIAHWKDEIKFFKKVLKLQKRLLF